MLSLALEKEKLTQPLNGVGNPLQNNKSPQPTKCIKVVKYELEKVSLPKHTKGLLILLAP